MDETQRMAYDQRIHAPGGDGGCGAVHRGERRTGVPVVMTLAEALGHPGAARHRRIHDRTAPGG